MSAEEDLLALVEVHRCRWAGLIEDFDSVISSAPISEQSKAEALRIQDFQSKKPKPSTPIPPASRQEKANAMGWLLRTSKQYLNHYETQQLLLLSEFGWTEASALAGEWKPPAGWTQEQQKRFCVLLIAHTWWQGCFQQIRAAETAWRASPETCSPCRIVAAVQFGLTRALTQFPPVLSNIIKFAHKGNRLESFAVLAGYVPAFRDWKRRSLTQRQRQELAAHDAPIVENLARDLTVSVADLPHKKMTDAPRAGLALIDLESPLIASKWEKYQELEGLASGGTSRNSVSGRRVQNESAIGSFACGEDSVPFFDTLPGGIDPCAELEAKELAREEEERLHNGLGNILGSGRQLEVLELQIMGYARPEIAERLGVGVETVNTHCTRIKSKLRYRPDLLEVYESLQHVSRKT